MTAITFIKSSLNDANSHIEHYVKSLTSAVDDFWESNIIYADIYKILKDNKSIGCFAVHNNEKLSMFTLDNDYVYMSQDIFKQILEDYNIKTAFVATCDELFLSLCMDFHTKIEPQAYFFDIISTLPVRSPEYGRECLSEIDYNEIGEINSKTDNFFGFVDGAYFETFNAKIYRLSVDGTDLGYGISVPNRFRPEYYACGMITLDEHRRKGVGRSIQIHLADICRENSVIPLSGCWYYNHLSRKTIESAGRYSKTRLLNVIF